MVASLGRRNVVLVLLALYADIESMSSRGRMGVRLWNYFQTF